MMEYPIMPEVIQDERATSRIKLVAAAEYFPPIVMEEVEVKVTLRSAYVFGYQVWLVLNQQSSNGEYLEGRGYVRGFRETSFYLNSKQIAFADVRAVEFASFIAY